MKTIKTLSTLFTAIILLVATEMASAQSYAETSEGVNVTAEVVTSLTFNELTGTLDFGTIGQDIENNSPSIDPTDGTTDNILDGGTPAKYTLSGTQGQTVGFTYNDATLTDDGGGTKDLTFSPDISFALGDQNETGNDGGSGGELLTTVTDAVLLDGFSDMTLWIGGSITDPDTEVGVVAGSYTGELTIIVDYVE